MKNKISQFALLIIGSCLFFSCSNQFISLQKRHYRDGYNVEYGFNKKEKGKEQKEKERKKPTYNNIASQEQAAIAETPKQKTEQQQEQPVAQNNLRKGELPQVVVDKKEAEVKAEQKNIVLEKKKAKISRTIATLEKKAKTHDDTLEDALSLFWIIILLFIMLWFLALLTGGWGLGALVNLLLVIALVLLILWLLRVL